MRSLEELLSGSVAGRRVLLRVDLNVPLDGTGIRDDTRIRAVLPTLKQLLEAEACPILCSHLGRPQGVDPRFSLSPVAKRLEELLDGPRVKFLRQAPGDAALKSAVQSLAPGELALLENLRFYPGEKANQEHFGRQLAALAEVYVNDAFGCCHRAHTSVVAPPQHLPAYSGLLVEKELAVLRRLRDAPERPFWILLGGAKVADKIGVIRNLLPRVDGFLVGGSMALTLLAGQGIPVGSSSVEVGGRETLGSLMEDASQAPEWVLPADLVAGDALRAPSRTEVVTVGTAPPPGSAFFDIGPVTAQRFLEKLEGARTVFWNGPLGVFEEPAYQHGTQTVAEGLAAGSGQRVIGGGDTAAAVRHFRCAERMSHVSTGGGASLEFLEGKVLPGIQALQDAASHPPTSHRL
ncbi:MAG: phosphoglycerate kinase [Planctomycetota bacterium]